MEAPIAQFMAPNRSFFNVFFKQAFSYSTQKNTSSLSIRHKRHKKNTSSLSIRHKRHQTNTSIFSIRHKKNTRIFQFGPSGEQKNKAVFCNCSENHKHFSALEHKHTIKEQALFATAQKTTNTFLHRNINTPSVSLYVAPETQKSHTLFCTRS